MIFQPTMRFRWVETDENKTVPCAYTKEYIGSYLKHEQCYKLQQAWIGENGDISWRDIEVAEGE